MGKNNAKLPDLATLISAGIDPKTGLPLKLANNKCLLKDDIKRQLRIKDESEFVNRYTWYNLPFGLSSEEMERLLYYKGQLVAFYEEATNKFYVTPYALDGTIDIYGRYNNVKPIPMTSGTDENTNKAIADLLSQKVLEVQYNILLDEEVASLKLNKVGVILRDYTNQLSQTIIPRCITVESLLDAMSDMVPFMRTRLLLGTGVKGLRVNDADQSSSVTEAGRTFERSALGGVPYTPIVGPLEFQELGDKGATGSEEYMLGFQSLDNLRKESMGLPSNGVYEKKAHMLQSEQLMNGTNVDLVLTDGLNNRQNFANIFNSIFGTGVWVEISETISCADINQDGVVYDENTPDVASNDLGGKNDVE